MAGSSVVQPLGNDLSFGRRLLFRNPTGQLRIPPDPCSMTSPSDDESKSTPGARATRGNDFAKYSGLGLQLGAAITVLALIGHWLDQRLGTEPWLLVVGVLCGSVGGTISLVSKVPPPQGGRRS